MCQLTITNTKVSDVCPIRTREAIAFDSLIDSSQEFRITYRLRQKLERAGFHSAHRTWNIPMSGDEDYWKVNTRGIQLTLKIKSRSSGHLHVEDQTACRIWRTIAQEVLGRSVGCCLLTRRADKILQRKTNRGIVIDNKDDR